MQPIFRVLNTLSDRINLAEVETVLDLGCGSFYNRDLALFKKRDILSRIFGSKDIVAVDVFEHDIEWRKKYGPPANYICMNILDFNIDRHYDVIICHHVLEHLTQEEHDLMFERIDSADCRYIVLGGPVGFSDNSAFVKIKENEHEEHKIGLDPEFYRSRGYEIFDFGPSFLAIKEKV